MDIKVLRKELSARSTIGELHIDGQFECFTLEDAVRPVKIKGVTAIPAGTYEVVINFSQRFQRQLPLLLNVPNFDGVRIHAGNTDADTEGRLLVGKTKSADFIGSSRAAFDVLFAKVEKAAAREKVFIEFVQPGDAVQPQAASRDMPSVRREITVGSKKAALKSATKSATKSKASKPGKKKAAR